MDEEVDSEDENVNSVLAQESSELLAILQSQSPAIIMTLIQMMPSDARRTISHPVTSVLALAEHIKVMLEYFRQASAADCRCFLHTMCMLCENIPLRLETRLISVAGDANAADAENSRATKPVTLRNTDVCEDSSPSVGGETLPTPHSDLQLVKRPRIDHWEQYVAAVMTLLQRRWGRLSEGLVTQVQLENVWISLRTASRGRDRPDQTPGSADRGSRTPEPDGDYGSMESRVTLDVFLQGCEGKVTVLVGQSGSGKTLLMSCLGQQWARRLGPIPSSFLFVLLEFRQLSLVSRPLSLSDLLFQLYLPPNGGYHEKRDILDYLISNPEQSVWVLDGYDEFHSKLTKQEAQGERLDPEAPLPVADLISGLLNRQLLPGCTVVVTCRVRDVVDLEGVSDKVGQLLGWDGRGIKDYVHNFFGTKANKALGLKAADLILSTRHLLAVSSLPALCNICCICLEYLLLEVGDAGRPQNPEERGGGGGGGVRRRAGERGVQIPGGGRGEEGRRGENCAQREDQAGRRRGSEDIMMDVTNVRAQPPPSTEAQIPPTLTQVYLTALGAFLSRDKRGSDKSKTTTHPQSTANVLSQYRSELCELSQLAWKGLENSKILFLEEDVSQDVLKFSIRTGLLSQVELRREDGTLVNSYCFVHLTVQEFLAALKIMTSQDVSDVQLKQRFSLKTRWMTKLDQRTVFTDSLYLYVCGLVSSCCTPALVQLAGSAGGTNWVQKRQALVLKLLKNLCHRNTLTGSKILELCHCIQESQDHQLAREVVGTRSTLELRNIRLLPNDIDALAFVVNSVGDNGIGLDFGACSMEPECLDDLPRCRHIRRLCFHSRKYGDNFAEKLASILPKFNTLREFEFCGTSLTAAGAASLASALQNCPGLTEINLSDNNLKDAGIELIAEVFTKLPRLDSVMLGRNNSSLKAVDYLIGKVSSCPNIQNIHAEGIKELTVTFVPNPELKSHKAESEPTISLLDQTWSKPEMKTVAESLVSCPALSVLDLSGGQWNEETLRTLAEFLPKFNITKKIIVNDSCSSVEALVILTALLSECPAVTELHIRLQSPVQVSIVFSRGREKPDEMSKVLCLSCSGLLPAHLDKVWRSLGRSSDLTFLDLSSNCLGNKGLKKLLEVLPYFRHIQEINASNNKMSMEGVVMLAGALSSHDNLTQIHISDGGRDRVTLKFKPDTSDDRQQLKVFRINSSLLPSNMSPLCRRLAQCRSQLEVDLSRSSLTDEALESLLKALPKMTSLQRLNVSHCVTSTAAALTLLRSLNVSQRVSSVELRLQTESFIHFDSVKAEHASCRLTHFSVSGDGVERLLQILQQGPQLSDLDLSSNHLGDEGVKRFLDFLPMLKISGYVNLSNNSLSQQGLLDVANTLCTCTNVSAVEVCLGAEGRCLIWFSQTEGGGKTLSVRHSRLEREHLLRLAEVVSVCPRLTQLEFRNNSLQTGWIEDFVKLLSGSQRVSVSIEESWIRSEEAVALVCRCLGLNGNIHTIRVHGTTLHISIMNSAQLTSVSLVDCAVEEDQLKSIMSIIQKCPLLTELDLSHNSLGVEGAEFLCSALPSLPNLTSLSLGSKQPCVHVVKKQLCEALLPATTVHSLNLSGHVIDDTAAQVMTGLLPRLRSLNLSHCVWTPAARLQLIKALGECVHLEDLCLDSLQLNEEIKVCLTQSLREIRSIRRLRLNKIVAAELPSGEKGVVDFLAALEGLTRMRELELEGWRMPESGVEQLTKLLPVWTELRKISLSKNLISDQSGDKLLEALSSCRCLEELHVSGNGLGDLTAARMALVLPSLTHMTVLDLSENRIGCEGSDSLSEAIMSMKNLTRIHLTSVGTSELCAVAASLAHCPLIQDVGLGWNNCDDKVAVELARVLPRCQKLIRIDLESNSVSVCGVEALLRALPSCPALQLVRLWRNKVSSSEASRLSAMDRRLNFSPT